MKRQPNFIDKALQNTAVADQGAEQTKEAYMKKFWIFTKKLKIPPILQMLQFWKKRKITTKLTF